MSLTQSRRRRQLSARQLQMRWQQVSCQEQHVQTESPVGHHRIPSTHAWHSQIVTNNMETCLCEMFTQTVG